MSRLVIVSNRVADPRKTAAGGLAVALGDALSAAGGVWFGWSGNIVPDAAAGPALDAALDAATATATDTAIEAAPQGATNSASKPRQEAASGAPPALPPVHKQRSGKVVLATVDLTQQDHDTYYRGYANGVLWPVFHSRLDLADFDSGFFEGYSRVNRMFARQLLPLLQAGDVIWIHDYHLIPLAAELRALGCRHRIGFFLHIPLPPQLMLAAIPAHRWLMQSLFAYDLVGLQSQMDMVHLTRYLCAEAHAEQLSATTFRAFGRTLVAGAFPIGIDVDDFVALTEGRDAQDTMATMRRQYAKRHLLVGIDRLDYSKGLPQRMRAFRRLLEQYPENRHQATLVQVAAPSREDVVAYNSIRREMESLCGAINGDFGDFDWMPIRYIHRTVARKRVPGLYRASRVGLVTPLRDGMNLVAKEYIAAQDAADPGVLVLSRFAGAAEQLTDALLVNPYDTHATADAIHQALHMPLAERQQRHQRLLAEVRRHDVHWWREQFLNALSAVERPEPALA